MKNIVIFMAVSTLPGFSGSNPCLIIVHPTNQAISDKNAVNEFIHVSLPFGVMPGQIVEQEMYGYNIISFVYELPQSGSRNDLVSLSFAIDKSANYQNTKILLSDFFEYLKKINALTIEILSRILKTIMEGVNNESQIRLEKGNQFDVCAFLQQKRLRLREERKIRGGMV